MKFQNKIDFQAHYLPKAYYEFLEEAGLLLPDGFPTPEWDESGQQKAMSELGIANAPRHKPMEIKGQLAPASANS